MTRFVAVGECMIEMAPRDEPSTFGMSFAGDTFNAAWYLARLRPDWQIEYLTTIGSDAISDQFVQFAQGAGIGTDYMMRHPSRGLGLYLIELNAGERSFQYWREHAAARCLADDPAALTAGFQGADVILFSGITLAILDPDKRVALLHALTAARKDGATIMFDPNIRQKLWSDLETMRSSIMAAAACADQVLPSFDEEAVYFGDKSPRETIKRYQDAGVGCVIVKNGADPIHYTYNGEICEFVPQNVDCVVDTTAAGDSFNAGYIANILSGHTSAQAIFLASQVSRQVIQHRGALVALAV